MINPREEDAERYFLQANTVTRPAYHIFLRHDLYLITYLTSQVLSFFYLRKNKRKRRNQSPPSSQSTFSSSSSFMDKEPRRKKHRGRLSRLNPTDGSLPNPDQTRVLTRTPDGEEVS